MPYFGYPVYPEPLIDPSKFVSVTSSMALNQTHYGKTFVIGGSGNFTITLMALQSGSKTLGLAFVNDSAGVTTINASGSNNIRVQGVNTNSIRLAPGDAVTLVNNGSTWNLLSNVSMKPNINATSLVQVSANATLNATSFGNTIVGNSTSNFTQTLPSVSQYPPGMKIEFMNVNSGTMTVQRSGLDIISVGGESVTSLTLETGDTLTLASSGTNIWFAVGGSVQLRYSKAFKSQASVGDIKIWPSLTIPDGWMICNGALLNRADYPELFQLITTTFNTGGETSLQFRLPQLCGEFIRGLDNGRGVDSGRTLGSWQESQNLSHDHYGTTAWIPDHVHGGFQQAGHDVTGPGSSFVTRIAFGDNAPYEGQTVNMAAGGHNHAFTTNISGIHEARPRNVAMNFIIRVI